MRTTRRSSVRVPRSRPVWRDPRFIMGILLVVASIVGVTSLVNYVSSGVKIYQATRDIAPGEALTLSNMAIVDARPGADVYLTATEPIEGLLAQHAFQQGELIPRAAATTSEDQTIRSLVITVDDGLPEGVTPGRNIELWFIPDARIGQEEALEAHQVSGKLSLVRIMGESGGIGRSAGTKIEIRTTAQTMGELLKYTHGNGKLVAVPVGAR